MASEPDSDITAYTPALFVLADQPDLAVKDDEMLPYAPSMFRQADLPERAMEDNEMLSHADPAGSASTWVKREASMDDTDPIVGR